MNFGEALDAAGKRTSHLLFSRRNGTRWRNFAILTFLTAGSAGSGFNFRLPPTGPTATGTHSSASDLWQTLGLGAHKPDAHTLVMVGVLFLVFVLGMIALGLVLTWFGAIARLVMVEDIVYDREAILEPAGRLRRLGSSYFWFTIAWGCAVALPLILVGGACFAIFAPDFGQQLQRGDFSSLFVMIGLGLLIILPLSLLIGAFGMFCDELVIPLMYREDLTAVPALKLLFSLVRRNPGQWFLFWLVHCILSVVGGLFTGMCLLLIVGMASMLILLVSAVPGVAVGCVAGSTPGFALGTSIFVAGGVFILLPLALCVGVPLVVFKRCFSIYCLQSFEPSFEMLPANGRYVLDQGATAASTGLGVPPLESAQVEPDGEWTRASDW